MENRTQKFCSIPLLFFTAFFPVFRLLNQGAALKIERKMSDLNITIDRYASTGTVMYYILIIRYRYNKTMAVKTHLLCLEAA